MIKCHTAPDTLVAQVAVAITPKLNPYGTIAIRSIFNYSSMSKAIDSIEKRKLPLNSPIRTPFFESV